MILTNLIYIYQLEYYDKKRFLAFVYRNFNWFKLKKRNSLIWTVRTKLIFAISHIFFVSLLLINFFYITKNLIYVLTSVIFAIIIYPFLIIFADLVITPLVRYKKHKIISKAKEIILLAKKDRELITIGITGSYGKTSMKNILTSLLGQKYKIFTFPGNINTDIGVAQYIIKNKETLKNSEIVISEMGAFTIGDIENLCKIINPDYSITTSIAQVHIERFKTLKNIINTKFELATNTRKIAFLNTCNDLISKNLANLSTDAKIVKICNTPQEKKYLENFGGISFKYNSQTFTTNLIADYSLNYIVIALNISKLLNLSKKELERGLKNMKFTPHRLEVLKNKELNRIIIDDSYNGNYDGFCAGIDIIKRAKGRKITLTPGIVELGKKSKEIHIKLAQKYAKNLDLVLLVKTKGTDVIVEKFKEIGYNNYKVYKTTKQAHDDLVNILKNGDTIIFQNDITDNYR